MNNPREIKFKFWCTTEKRFIDDPVIHKMGTISVMDGISGHDWCNDVILLQYTGCKDANGKEIYEGDIVTVSAINHYANKTETITESVVWGEYGDDEYVDCLECWMIGYRPLSSVAKSQGLRYNADETDPLTLEVIGNIFETPELIKNV